MAAYGALTTTGGTPIKARPTGPPTPQPRSSAPTYQTKVDKPPAPPRAQANAGPRGHYVAVGDKWVLIHATGKNQWARGGVAGHRAPPRPTGATPLPNNPLAPLTQGQIQRTATKTVNGAYAGDLGDLNNQTKQAQNLYNTQQTDDHAFSQWLVQQTANLTNSVSGTNQKLSDMVTGLRSAQATQLAGAAPAAAQASEGGSQQGVGTPGQSEASLGALTAPYEGAANNKLAGEVASAAQGGITNQLAAGQTGDIAQARVSATQNTELGNLTKSLSDIAASRTKLLASKTGDITKEIARLQGVELSKRQFLINEAAAEKAANISQSNTLDEIQARDAGVLQGAQRVGIEQQNANTAMTRAQQTQMNSDRTFKLNSQKFGAEQAKTMYQEEHGLGAFKPTKGTVAANRKPLSAPQIRTLKSSINQIRSALSYDVKTYHGSDKDPAKALEQAYHDLTNPVNVKSDKYLAPLVGKGIDVGLLNAAYNSLGNGLTAGDIQYLQQSGTWDVGSNYPVARHVVGPAIAGTPIPGRR